MAGSDPIVPINDPGDAHPRTTANDGQERYDCSCTAAERRACSCSERVPQPDHSRHGSDSTAVPEQVAIDLQNRVLELSRDFMDAREEIQRLRGALVVAVTTVEDWEACHGRPHPDPEGFRRAAIERGKVALRNSAREGGTA